MSFYTSLFFYRPGAPPTLSGADLAAFVANFASLGLAGGTGPIGYRVKFGRAIDQDERPTHWDEPVTPDGIVSVARRTEFDVEEADLLSLARLTGNLAKLDGLIYRADLDLGYVADPIYSRTERSPSEENDAALELSHWGLQVGPILSHALGGDAVYMVGWIAVAMHGHGYLYPWGLRELVDRVEAAPGVVTLMALCREAWPVGPEKPPRGAVRARKKMGELWPYVRADLPGD
jgi:hypothetical protein